MSEVTSVLAAPITKLPFLGNVDLTVGIDEEASDCFTVVFTVTMRMIPPVVVREWAAVYRSSLEKLALPGINPSVAIVEVRVWDECGNIDTVTLEMPVSLDDVSQTVAVNLQTDRCTITPGSWGRTFYVLVDPANKLAEVNEGNNFAKSFQECIT